MSTIFDSAQVRKSNRFGRGVLRSLPAYRPIVSAADEAAYVAMMNAGPDFDRLAEQSAALDRLERGLDC